MKAFARASNTQAQCVLSALLSTLPGAVLAWCGLPVVLFALPCAALAQKLPDKSDLLAAPPRTASNDERLLFESANQERARRQLPLLKWDDALAEAARQHARAMARQHGFAHQLPGEPSLSQRAGASGAHFARVGENIALGTDSGEIHDGWMESPGHRANILDKGYTALGVGTIVSNDKLYAVEDFSVAVESLGLKAQEDQVAAQLAARGLQVVAEREMAQQLCQGRGTRGRGGTMYIMHYEVSDLSELPEQVVRKIHEKGFRKAEVGACAPKENSAGFARFRITVVLF